MAQRPWEVLRERSLALPEANRFLKKARNDLLSSIFIPHRSDVRKTSAQTVKSRPPCSDLILDTLQDICRKLEDKRLIQTPFLDSGVFKKCHIRGLVQLWPMYVAYPTYGTMKYLNDNFALQYVPELNGVMLAFRKISAQETEAFSYESEPSGVMVFNIEIEAVLFSPQAGQILVGEITEIQEGFVMCAVLGIWQARIPASQLPDGATITAVNQVPNELLTSSGVDSSIVEDQFVVVLKKQEVNLGDEFNAKDTPPQTQSKSKSKRKFVMKRKSVVKFLVVRVVTSTRDAIQSASIIIEGSMR